MGRFIYQEAARPAGPKTRAAGSAGEHSAHFFPWTAGVREGAGPFVQPALVVAMRPSQPSPTIPMALTTAVGDPQRRPVWSQPGHKPPGRDGDGRGRNDAPCHPVHSEKGSIVTQGAAWGGPATVRDHEAPGSNPGPPTTSSKAKERVPGAAPHAHSPQRLPSKRTAKTRTDVPR